MMIIFSLLLPNLGENYIILNEQYSRQYVFLSQSMSTDSGFWQRSFENSPHSENLNRAQVMGLAITYENISDEFSARVWLWKMEPNGNYTSVSYMDIEPGEFGAMIIPARDITRNASYRLDISQRWGGTVSGNLVVAAGLPFLSGEVLSSDGYISRSFDNLNDARDVGLIMSYQNTAEGLVVVQLQKREGSELITLESFTIESGASEFVRIPPQNITRNTKYILTVTQPSGGAVSGNVFLGTDFGICNIFRGVDLGSR